jgi:hypothetical protein
MNRALPWLIALLGTTPGPPVKVALQPIELNNLHKTSPDSSPAPRIQALAFALQDRLQAACRYQLVAVDSTAWADADRGVGYFYDHPDIAAGLAGSVGAD